MLGTRLAFGLLAIASCSTGVAQAQFLNDSVAVRVSPLVEVSSGALNVVPDAIPGQPDPSPVLAPPFDRFVAGPAFAVDPGAVSVAALDADGDGHMDVLSANFLSNSLTLLRGNGDGTFVRAHDHALASRPTWVLALPPRDGLVRFAVARTMYVGDPGHIALYEISAGGTFALLSEIEVQSFPIHIAATPDPSGEGTLLAVPHATPWNRAISLLRVPPNDSLEAVAELNSGYDSNWAGFTRFAPTAPVQLGVASLYCNAISTFTHENGIWSQERSIGVQWEGASWTTPDLNGDALPDMVIGNLHSSASVLLNDGAATFGEWLDYPTLDGPIGAWNADFDDDGLSDVLFAHYASSGVSLLRSDGTGGLLERQGIGGGMGATSAAIADFDGDGILDVVTADWPGSVTFLRGDGSGGLVGRTIEPVASSPYSVVTDDLDGDGILDLALALRYAHAVGILRGRGDGRFDPVQLVPAGSEPQDVKTADLDGDGVLDLVVANQYGPGIGIHRGHGDGTFEPPVYLPADQEPFGVATGDLDDDGRPEVLAACYGAGSLLIYWNQGGLTFGPVDRHTPGGGPTGIAVAPLTATGRLEFAVTRYASSGVVIYGNFGSRQIHMREIVPTPAGPWRVIALQMPAFARPSLIVANRGGNTVSILENSGVGTFPIRYELPVGHNPSWLASADVDGDGDLDVAITNFGSHTVSLLANMGAYLSPAGALVGGRKPVALAAGDFDRNGLADFAVAADGDRAVTFLSQRSDDVVAVPAPAAHAASDLEIWPQPVRARAELRFHLPREADVGLRLLDVQGRELRRLDRRALAAGLHAVVWDVRDEAGRRCPPGVYFVALDAAGSCSWRRLVVLP